MPRLTIAFMLAAMISVSLPQVSTAQNRVVPMVEDPYRWYGIQAKLIAAIRSGAPEHTIIASGHRWSGLYELLSLQAYSDPNIIYNFHFYEPFTFTHQGATWAGNNLPYF